MKKLFLSFVIGALALSGCDLFVDPVAYNDTVVETHTKAIDAYNEYVDQSDATPLEGDLDGLDQKRLETIETVKGIRDEIKAMDDLKGDDGLKSAFADDLDDMISVLENQDSKLIELWKRMAEVEGDLPQEMIDEESAIFEEINQAADNAYTALDSAQEAFAEEHGYELETAPIVTP